MGTEDLSPKAFEAWLRTDKNQSTLKKIAGKTYKKMKEIN